MELEEHNNADDKFSENMINVLQLAANAHKTFLLSINEKKRKLIKLVLSTKKLYGRKLVYTLRPPFDAFVETDKNVQWWALVDRFRQINEYRIVIIYLPQEAGKAYFCNSLRV
jgi:hypothetical protein